MPSSYGKNDGFGHNYTIRSRSKMHVVAPKLHDKPSWEMIIIEDSLASLERSDTQPSHKNFLHLAQVYKA